MKPYSIDLVSIDLTELLVILKWDKRNVVCWQLKANRFKLKIILNFFNQLGATLSILIINNMKILEDGNLNIDSINQTIFPLFNWQSKCMIVKWNPNLKRFCTSRHLPSSLSFLIFRSSSFTLGSLVSTCNWPLRQWHCPSFSLFPPHFLHFTLFH